MLLSSSIASSQPQGSSKEVILHVWGQSNGSDIVPISGNLSSPYTDVMTNAWAVGDGTLTRPFHAGYNSRSGDTSGTIYGITASLAYRLSAFYSKRTVIASGAVLNTSLCTPAFGSGTNGSWNINDPSSLYTVAVNTFALPAINRLSKTAESVIVWIQGESDAGDPTAAAAYYQNMVDLINKSRSSVGSGGLGIPDLKWIVIELRSTHGTEYQTIRTAEQNLASNISGVYYFDTSFVTLQGDNIHWSPSSFVTGGNNLADFINPLLTF